MDDQLIGREREQAQLLAWLTAARAGRGSVVLLAGEAGVGKTTFLAQRAAEAATEVPAPEGEAAPADGTENVPASEGALR